MSAHKEIKTNTDYILSGLPGFDVLNGGGITPKVILYSLHPSSFERRMFDWYVAENYEVLTKVFQEGFIKDHYNELKFEYLKSFNEIETENKLDLYDIWDIIERQPQFSHMADLVENDLFQIIAPLTDIELLKIFNGIPTSKRIFSNYGKSMLYKYYPEIRRIELDEGRGRLKKRNNIPLHLIRFLLSKLSRNENSDIWNISEAIRFDSKIDSIILDNINEYDELKNYIFNVSSIKLILENHKNRSGNYTSVIGSLLTFIYAYKYFIIDTPNQIPFGVDEFYYDFYNR